MGGPLIIGGLVAWLGSLPFVIGLAVKALVDALNQPEPDAPVMVGLDDRDDNVFSELDIAWLAEHQIGGVR